MAIKIRRPKKTNQPTYKDDFSQEADQDQNFGEHYKQVNERYVTKRFWFILGICAFVLIILIVALTTTINSTAKSSSVSAVTTYAVTTAEQQQMIDTSKLFATSLYVSGYCSDANMVSKAKTAALALMQQNTESYNLINSLSSGGSMAYDNIGINLSTPSMVDGTQSYADTYTYSFVGYITDKSSNSTAAGSQYNFKLTFVKAKDSDGSGNDRWLISYANVAAE